MARNKEDIQDSLLRQMDKLSRRSERPSGDLTFEEQLKKQAAYDKMSDEQKRAATPKRIWMEKLIEYVVHIRKVCTSSEFGAIAQKNAEDINEFHVTGASFPSTISFFEEKTYQIVNRIK